jgi:hypothetical protein
MNEPDNNSSIVEPVVESELAGRTVITADGDVIGPVEAETETHLRVRAAASDAGIGQLWLPKDMIGSVDRESVRLTRERADLHDAVLAMPPGQQREFGSLSLNLRIGRMRGLGHEGR